MLSLLVFFFQPDVCTRIFAGVLKSLSLITSVSQYVAGNWHNETVGVNFVPYDIKYMTLPNAFNGSTRIPIIDTLVGIYIAILDEIRGKGIGSYREFPELFLMAPVQREYVPLLPSKVACRSYASKSDSRVLVMYRSWIDLYLREMTSGNRLRGSAIPTAKTSDLETVIKRIRDLISYTLEGVCLRMRIAVRMCLIHPLRIASDWKFTHTQANDSRVGVKVDYLAHGGKEMNVVLTDHYESVWDV